HSPSTVLTPLLDNGSCLGVLSAGARYAMQPGWNDTAHPLTAVTLPDLFEEQLAKTPDSIAVVFEQRRLTYAELDRRANQLAHRLIRLGVGPDKLVGIAVERSLEMVVGLLGILKAGGAYRKPR